MMPAVERKTNSGGRPPISRPDIVPGIVPEIKGATGGSLRQNLAIATRIRTVSPTFDSEIAGTRDNAAADRGGVVYAVKPQSIPGRAAMSSFSNRDPGIISVVTAGGNRIKEIGGRG